MLDQDDLPGYRVVALSRISDISATDSTSLTKQDNKLIEEVDALKEEYDGELVRSFSNKQSASTMDREDLNEIYEMAKNDEFDILMVWRVHRLTRARPLETMRYIIKLMDEDIVLYSDRDGYYDWTDLDDNSQIMQRAKTSKAWRDEIHYGSITSNKEILRDGEYPYGRLGYGLTTDDNDKIAIKQGYDKIINPLFRAYFECGDIDTTVASVKNKIDNDNLSIEPPTDNQVDTALGNELYIGELIEKKSGDKVGEKGDIKVIDSEIFSKVQNMRLEVDEETDSPDIDEFPTQICDLISRYGQEYIANNISGIRWCCPKCSSTNINVSNTTIEKLGINLPRIYCKNDDEGCGYQGPAIRKRELYNIDRSLPLVCPECQRTEEFEVEEVDITNEIESMEEIYKYTCQHCGSSMIKDVDPDPNVRGLDSSNAIRLESNTEQADTTKKEQTKSDNTENGDDMNIELTTVLEEYLEKEGPNKAVAREIMITAASLLAEEGPMTTADLKNELHERYGKEYSSKDSMWESTFMRLYSDIPMVTKVSYGEYDFRDEQFRLVMNSILDLLSTRS